MFFSKNSKYEMNKETANATLQNVFAACDKAPNTIPFDKLLLREKLNTHIYDRLVVLVLLLLLFTFLSPLAIVPVSESLERVFAPEKVQMTDNYVEDGFLYIQLKGDNILYEDAYLERSDGTIVPATSYDIKTKIICFPFVEDGESNIYIPVTDSSPLHLLLSPQ